ncbi:conserved hypothetical protein (plasmid) [Gloeothece citriformis PCC 7424]|uniref:Uncharacterized protein n=1 Tax=Gloeothece citriformis (strain PCC 7424) TaxID=65393 RepID=B7KMG1_GLOC7|nr:CHAT domain-containing protein [Gloeothece citriformis]ACK73983.1 conserved hypothetical protein [Gloeothece citriformis PCC 7424]
MTIMPNNFSQQFILKLEGDFKNGFNATLEIGEQNQPPLIETLAELPSHTQLWELYQNWQNNYSNAGRVTILSSNAERESSQNCLIQAKALKQELNQWFKSTSFFPIREKWLQYVTTSKITRILLRLRSSSEEKLINLRRIPWHLWELIENYNLELILSNSTSETDKKNKFPTEKGKVRILAILGNSQGIDIEKDLSQIRQLPRAEIEELIEPQRHQISDRLWEQPWDILFFAGHSHTENDSGKLFINATDYLSLEDLNYGLRKAIDQGLQLAIFNSCDGLGLAHQLEALQIPHVIVMREPVPDIVAQEFLKYFLNAFAGGQSLSLAVREARQRLQGLEDNFPCASWLPVLCQHINTITPQWEDLGYRPTTKIPYRGLSAFRTEDAAFFKGRETFTHQLLTAIETNSLITIIGPSGSGKSSVVLAGLIPQLPSSWQIITLRPSDRPCYNLALALIDRLNPHFTNPTERLRQIRQLATDLRQEKEALRDVIEALIAPVANTRMLLMVDQAEELYSVCRNEQERQSFWERLLEAVAINNNYQPYFVIVLTLRADFYESILGDPTCSHRLLDSLYPLRPMTPDELASAIIEPAALFGVTLEEGLTQRILKDIGTEPGQLPLLEFALTQLWQKQEDTRLKNGIYDDIGGVQGALAQYAETVYHRLNEEEKKRIRRIFIQLVNPGEKKRDTRRLATRQEVGEENWELITQLANARLWITDSQLVLNDKNELKETETVEIVHEALLTGWFRLENWLAQDREFRLWQERLRSHIRQWHSNYQDNSALLRGNLLKEAEGWLEQKPVEFSLEERIFIQKSQQERSQQRRNRLMGFVASFAIIAAGSALIYQLQQKWSLQLVRNVASGTESPTRELSKILGKFQRETDKIRLSGSFDRAIEDYAYLMTASQKLLQEIPDLPDSASIKEISQAAENSLAQTIQEHRLPQLESELKQGNFGEFNGNDWSRFEEVATGALKITYAILMSRQGANADQDRNGYLTPGEEMRLPCKTLKDIEELWKKFTNNRCGFRGKDDNYDAPNCQELAQYTLTVKLSFTPYRYLLEERLQQCQILPIESESSTREP